MQSASQRERRRKGKEEEGAGGDNWQRASEEKEEGARLSCLAQDEHKLEADSRKEEEEANGTEVRPNSFSSTF